ERWRGNEATRLQEAIDAGFRDERALTVGEGDGDLTRRAVGLVEGKLDDPLAHAIGNAVPDAAWLRPMILEGIEAAGRIAIEPGVEGRLGDTDLVERAPDWEVRGLDGADDLELFGCGVSHSPSSPSAITLFLSRRFSRVTSASASLSWRASARSVLTSSDVASRAVSPASRFLPASRNSLDQR